MEKVTVIKGAGYMTLTELVDLPSHDVIGTVVLPVNSDILAVRSEQNSKPEWNVELGGYHHGPVFTAIEVRRPRTGGSTEHGQCFYVKIYFVQETPEQVLALMKKASELAGGTRGLEPTPEPIEPLMCTLSEWITGRLVRRGFSEIWAKQVARQLKADPDLKRFWFDRAASDLIPADKALIWELAATIALTSPAQVYMAIFKVPDPFGKSRPSLLAGESTTPAEE